MKFVAAGMRKLVVAAVVTGSMALGAVDAGEPYRVTGDAVAWTDELGRLVLAVDGVGPDGVQDGRTDEIYLLAPSTPGTFEVGPRGMSGTIVWSQERGFVAVFDERGVERWTMTTRDRDSGSQWFRGVELVRVAGPFDSSVWTTTTHDIPTVLGSEPHGGPASSPVAHGADSCQSGGVGATSCSRRCTTLFSVAGGTSCQVSCGDGYYACCQCDVGLVARCICRLAPRDDRDGDSGSDPEWPSPCRPLCRL